MKYLKYLALVGVLMVPLAYSQAEVRVGIGIGFGPSYVAGPPVCAYGYYSYYPYACAPYGFYGPSYFVNGIFIGAGPWYNAPVDLFGRRIMAAPTTDTRLLTAASTIGALTTVILMDAVETATITATASTADAANESSRCAVT
jgi:hypothetical protein